HIALAFIEDCAVHVGKYATRALGQDLDAAEVEESDRAVQTEAVVPGMGIGVEQVRVPIRPHSEPPDRLCPGVLELLIGLLRCGPVHPVEIGHGQNPITGCLLNDVRYPDEGVAAVEPAERGDVSRLMTVV